MKNHDIGSIPVSGIRSPNETFEDFTKNKCSQSNGSNEKTFLPLNQSFLMLKSSVPFNGAFLFPLIESIRPERIAFGLIEKEKRLLKTTV